MNENVDFAADTKLGQIDAWLDCEQRFGKNAAGFVSFQIVNVSAVAVGFLRHIVTGAVAELRTVTRFFDHTANCVIDFPALQGSAGGKG